MDKETKIWKKVNWAREISAVIIIASIRKKAYSWGG